MHLFMNFIGWYGTRYEGGRYEGRFLNYSAIASYTFSVCLIC